MLQINVRLRKLELSRVRVTSQVLLYSLLYSQWKPTIFINQEFSWLSYARNQLNLLCSISNFAKILFSPLKFSLSNMPYNNVIVFSLRSSKITVNQTSACTELIFITTVANLRNCCILLCSYCVVLLAKQQGIKVNWLWKQMVLIYLIGHLPNFVTNLRVLQITYFLRVKSFTRNLRPSKTRQISCQAM